MTITFDNLILVETKNGNLTLKITCDDGSVKTLHSLYDPEGEARAIVDSFQFEGKGLLVVLGLGLGYHLHELVRRFPDANILVIEANSEIYELAKEHGNISEFGDKVRFIVSYPPKDALEEITSLQMKAGIVPLSIFTLSSAFSTFPRYYQPILDKLKSVVSFKLWERLRYPKFKDDNIRIAIVDFGYFLNVEIEKTVKSLGHLTAKIPGSKEERPGDILGRMIKVIVDFKPDFILTINHLGFDEEGILSSFLSSVELPAASWYVDSPNIIVKAFNKNASPYVSIFLWDKSYMKDMKNTGFEHIEYLPLATDEEVFKPINLKPSDIKIYGADVGFVGNSMVKPTMEKLERLPQELHPLVKRMAQLLSFTRIHFADAMKTLNENELKDINILTVQQKLDFEGAVLWQATLNYRLSCVKALKEFHPAIHGDKHWKELLHDGYRLKPQLNYYKELPVFFNSCKINFNATSLQMLTAVNQRVFDVPACGSFLLTDHQEAIEGFFEVDKEIVTYKNIEEIPELVRFYLNNPGARKEVAEKGRERVLKEHTYKHRLNTIIQVMRDRYG